MTVIGNQPVVKQTRQSRSRTAKGGANVTTIRREGSATTIFSLKPRPQLIDVSLRQSACLRCRDDLLHVPRPGLAGGAIGSNVDKGLGLSATRNVDFHESFPVKALHHALVPIEGALVFLRSFLDELQE